MTVEHNQQLLGQAYASPDPAIREAASNAQQYTEMFKQGQLSKDEYQQAIADLAIQARINQSMNDLSRLEMLNTAINGLINLASLAG